jgi:hypothetical protein
VILGLAAVAAAFRSGACAGGAGGACQAPEPGAAGGTAAGVGGNGSNGSGSGSGEQAAAAAAAGRELKLTMLMTWREGAPAGEFDLWCHGEALPARPRPPVKLLIRWVPFFGGHRGRRIGRALLRARRAACGPSPWSSAQQAWRPVAAVWASVALALGTLPLAWGPAPPAMLPPPSPRGLPRANAKAKDSEWVRQRRALEEAKPSDVNEVRAPPPAGASKKGKMKSYMKISNSFQGSKAFGKKVVTAKAASPAGHLGLALTARGCALAPSPLP